MRPRPGPKTGACSKVSQLIFSRIGPEFPIRSQAALRSAAGIGAHQIINIRLHPDKVSDECLARLAHTVGIGVEQVLQSAERSYDNEKIRLLQETIRQTVPDSTKNFSPEELQKLPELGKLAEGSLPISFVIQFVEILRKNRRKGSQR